MEYSTMVLQKVYMIANDEHLKRLECGVQMYRASQDKYDIRGCVTHRRNVVRCFVECKKRIKVLEQFAAEKLSPEAVNYCSELLKAMDEVKGSKLSEISDWTFYPMVDKALDDLGKVNCKYAYCQ